MTDGRISETLDNLAKMNGSLEEALRAIPNERMKTQSSPEVWSPHQILGHLVDAEIAFSFRLRKILAEENPSYPPFDEERWGERLRHEDIPVLLFVSVWKPLRELNIQLLRLMPALAWERQGVHETSGSQTVMDVVQGMILHDNYHLKQLKACGTSA
jgi:uncharacterized damage-inducible protein DinB